MIYLFTILDTPSGRYIGHYYSYNNDIINIVSHDNEYIITYINNIITFERILDFENEYCKYKLPKKKNMKIYNSTGNDSIFISLLEREKLNKILENI